MLPRGGEIRAEFCQVDMLVQVVDLGDGDWVMVPMRGTLFGQLDLTCAVQMIYLAYGLFVE